MGFMWLFIYIYSVILLTVVLNGLLPVETLLFIPASVVVGLIVDSEY